MRSVSIIGIGQTPVGRSSARTLHELGAASLRMALQDAGAAPIQALYVSSLSAVAADQQDLAALIARHVGADPTQATIVAAHCGSGAALHMGVQAVAAGAHDIVAVTGVDAGCSMPAAESPDEAAQGLSLDGLCALIMQRYMYEYSWRREDFAGFAANAQANAATNANALQTEERSAAAHPLAEPLGASDVAPLCDGSATVILCESGLAARYGSKPVRVLASGVARDTASLHDRADALWLKGAHDCAAAAYAQAGRTPDDIDLFELHDAFTILAALSLEAAGFAEQGSGVRLAQDGSIGLRGRIPISTLGGLMGRGNTAGASGVYQVVEATLQLRGQAGKNQVQRARTAMTQTLGGGGACVATHILEV